MANGVATIVLFYYFTLVMRLGLCPILQFAASDLALWLTTCEAWGDSQWSQRAPCLRGWKDFIDKYIKRRERYAGTQNC